MGGHDEYDAHLSSKVHKAYEKLVARAEALRKSVASAPVEPQVASKQGSKSSYTHDSSKRWEDTGKDRRCRSRKRCSRSREAMRDRSRSRDRNRERNCSRERNRSSGASRDRNHCQKQLGRSASASPSPPRPVLHSRLQSSAFVTVP